MNHKLLHHWVAHMGGDFLGSTCVNKNICLKVNIADDAFRMKANI